MQRFAFSFFMFQIGGKKHFFSNNQNLEPVALQPEALYSFQLFCREQVYSRRLNFLE